LPPEKPLDTLKISKMKNFNLERYLIWTGYSVIVGLMAGVAATLLLFGLAWVTQLRITHPAFLYALPFVGLAIGLMYHRYGKDVERGTNLIIDEIHSPKQITPARSIPLIFFSTIFTHLAGGSAGREGVVVQTSAALADQLSRWFPITNEERSILLISGAGAGFGAAIGAPIAGVIFGMEFIRIGRIRPIAWFECAVASFTAYAIARFLEAPHSVFPMYSGSAFNLKLLIIVALSSVVFSALTRSFMLLTHSIEKTMQRFCKLSYLKPAIGGFVLLVLYKTFSLETYAGLGLDTIQESFTHSMPFQVPLIKLVLTAITIAVGFKGGEFMPLVFIGASAGSAISGLEWVSADTATLQALAAVGFAATFGAASNTPIACAIMAIELFGWKIAPYALLGCYLSYLMTGNLSIYRAQLTKRD
jgi:H+/Cl- antiporter ClcA